MKLILLALVFFLSSSLAEAGLFSRKTNIQDVKRKIERMSEKGHQRTKGSLYAALGDLLYKNGQFEDAVKAYETALTFGPRKKLKKNIFVFLGKSYESFAQFDKAIAAYEQAVFLAPKDWKRQRDLAGLYERVKLYKPAVKHYKLAIKRNDKYPILYMSLGQVQLKQGVYNKAEASYLKARKLGIRHKELWKKLSQVYEGQGRFTDAVVAYEKALNEKSNPEDWARFVYLAVLAENKTFANQGMNKLREKKLTDGSLQFYESLVQVSGQSFEEILRQKDTDPFIRSLFEVVKDPINQ